MLTFTQMACPTLTCKFSPSSRIASAKHTRHGEDTGNHKMLGEDHMVEPASSTTATAPWLLTNFLLASCSKMGHSGCPSQNRRCQNRAFRALQAFMQLAARGDATEPMPLRTSWGMGNLSVDRNFIADEGWQAMMQQIQQTTDHLLRDPMNKSGGPSLTDWSSLASTLWHCTRLCWLSKGVRKNKTLHDTMRAVTSVTLVCLTRGFIRWVSTQSEPCTAELLGCQGARKNLHPVLVSRLEQKHDQRSAIRNWEEDGLRVGPNQ